MIYNEKSQVVHFRKKRKVRTTGFIKMDHSKLTYKVFEYDLQNISNVNWSGDLETIAF